MIKHLKALGIFIIMVAVLSIALAALLWITGTENTFSEYVMYVTGGILLSVMIGLFIVQGIGSILDVYSPSKKTRIYVSHDTIKAMLMEMYESFEITYKGKTLESWKKYDHKLNRLDNHVEILRALKQGVLSIVTHTYSGGEIEARYVITKELHE